MAITIRSRTPATRPARPRARRRAAPARSSLPAGRRLPRAPGVRQHAGSTLRAAQRQGPVSPSMGRRLLSARSDRSEVVDVRRGTNHSATAASGIGAEYTARDRYGSRSPTAMRGGASPASMSQVSDCLACQGRTHARRSRRTALRIVRSFRSDANPRSKEEGDQVHLFWRFARGRLATYKTLHEIEFIDAIPKNPFGQDPAPRPHGARALLSGPPLTSRSRKGSQCA